MAKIHEIDPNSDTVIILKNPFADFAVWNYSDETERDARDSVSPVDCSTEECSTDGSVVEPSEPDDSSQEVIRYHVSSSVLKLASPHFERLLTGGNWKEGTPNEVDGRYHITVEDWDEEALLILLNAIHLRNRQVPRSLSLEMLAKIALLVDYYNCAETVELWTEIWTKDLTPSIRLEPSRNLFLWMYIAWVFRLPDEFTRTTAAVTKRSKQNQLSISDLPVERFVDRIARARNDAISAIVSKLHSLRKQYRSLDHFCPEGEYSFECGSILYGALTKGMDCLGLLSTPQEDLFSVMSLQEICTDVRNMTSPQWYTSRRNPYPAYHPNYGKHGCDLTNELEKITDEIEDKIEGLQLTDFARNESS